MTRGWLGGLGIAGVAALSRLRWWPLALAAFLVRGGVILVLLPIVSLPSLTEVASALGPVAVAFAIGQPSTDAVLALAAATSTVAAIMLLALSMGTWLDLELLRETGADEEVDLPVHGFRTPIARAVLARFAAHLGTMAALVYATFRLGYAAYAEALSPGDAGTLVLRVLAAAPDAPLVLLVAWVLGEAIGGIAVRRVAAGASVPAALGRGLVGAFRPAAVVAMLVTNGVLIGVGLPFWLAASRAWIHVRAYLLEAAPLPFLGLALLLLVVIWVLGLSLLAAALTWRQVAWTTVVFPWRAVDATGEPAVEPVKA